MKYDIDLKMPNVCKACGYKCCEYVQKKIKCPKPIFSTNYCYRNSIPLCKSYPLAYDVEKKEFVIRNCLGFMSIKEKIPVPYELIQVVENLNHVMNYIEEYGHIGPDVILTVKQSKDFY